MDLNQSLQELPEWTDKTASLSEYPAAEILQHIIKTVFS